MNVVYEAYEAMNVVVTAWLVQSSEGSPSGQALARDPSACAGQKC